MRGFLAEIVWPIGGGHWQTAMISADGHFWLGSGFWHCGHRSIDFDRVVVFCQFRTGELAVRWIDFEIAHEATAVLNAEPRQGVPGRIALNLIGGISQEHDKLIRCPVSIQQQRQRTRRGWTIPTNLFLGGAFWLR